MRNDQLRRNLRVFIRLLDGRPRHARDFADIYEGKHKRTLFRDLADFMDIPEAKLASGKDEYGKWYRVDIKKVKDVPRIRVCWKCPEKGFQPIDQFGLVSSAPDGRRRTCKTCMNRARREWYSGNSKKSLQYRKRNRRRSMQRKRIVRQERRMLQAMQVQRNRIQ